ncbi:MAG: sigma-54-dependent transcriptional regulator [Ignavibacteriaceae bacterium]
MNKGRVLVIDDEINILKMIELSLQSQGFQPEVFSSGLEGLKKAQEKYFDIAFIDLKMLPMTGLEVLAELKKISPDTTVVLITAYSSIETAVEAIKKGAYDYILKPFNHREFSHIVDRVYNHHLLEKEVKGLKTQIEEINSKEDIQTRSYMMREIIKTALEVANSDLSVLIEGESGTGKELLARMIHKNCNRKDSLFVPINCGAIPETLFESELFGHSKGAFTGAIKHRMGRLELADGGTVFLDEVAELPKSMQVKLLRFLQNMEFERVGESFSRKINVRIICATNRDVDKDLAKGDLRDDFFYRISTVRIKLPALRERKEDIPILLEYFLSENSSKKGFVLTPDCLQNLVSYDWPGNIRELENVVKRFKVLAKDGVIKTDHLPPEIVKKEIKQFPEMMESLEDLEKRHISEVLSKSINAKEAAKILGISETTLWRKRKIFKI